MGLRFDPVGGGQFKAAEQQILALEEQPVKQLQGRKALEEKRMQLFQQFKAKFQGMTKAIDEIDNFRKFRELKVDLGDGKEAMSVTVDKDKAEPGTYQVQVDQLAQKSSIISNGFEDPDKAVLGIGYIVMDQANGDTKEIFVDEKHSSLHGIANLINSDRTLPVHASVIKDSSDTDSPWKIIISAKKDGAPNGITFPDFYFLDGEKELYIDNNRDAQNAQVSLDGFPLQVEGNNVNNFLEGVNVQLKQAMPDKPFTMSISQDYDKISGKMKSIVDNINGILDFINKQNEIDEHSDTRATFAGDTSLQTIEYRLRNLMHEGFPVSVPNSDDYDLMFLNQMGVTFDKNGHLDFKQDQFQKFMEKDFDGVSEAITGPHGFAAQIREVISGYTRPGDGLLATREQGIRSRIKDFDRQIDEKERQIDQKQKSLTEKFSRLEASLANMQRQQQYMAATLPGASGGGNLVSQLLGG